MIDTSTTSLQQLNKWADSVEQPTAGNLVQGWPFDIGLWVAVGADGCHRSSQLGGGLHEFQQTFC